MRTADAGSTSAPTTTCTRPFTRAQLLARARAGLRAVQQRSDDALLRSLMATVPGAIYRSAWHAGHRLELITDEIERISGYPADNFIASARRTLISIIHEDDRDRVHALGRHRQRPRAPVRRSSTGSSAPTGRCAGCSTAASSSRGAGGRLWMDGAIFDITERRTAEEALRRREIEAARTEELRASRVRIVAAADSARRKIERDLHDGAQQRLVALALDVRVMRARAADGAGRRAGPFLDRPRDELAAASAELRELARGIHPAVLTDRGLGAAIEALARPRARARRDRRRARRAGSRRRVETTAYFTVAEALTNVAKYARATYAAVRVEQEDGCLVVEVRDDGVGGAAASTGSGLAGLSDRVGAIDGTLSVTSPPGEGTLVRAELPLTPSP